MTSLFPQRSSQAEFLKLYEQLPDDVEDNGIDLLDCDERNGEEDGEEAKDLDSLIDATHEDRPEDVEMHKALDAARRAEEHALMESLALRFEERAMQSTSNEPQDAVDPEVRRQAKLARREARRVAQEAEQAALLEAAKRRADAEQKDAADRRAWYALFELETEGQEASCCTFTAMPKANPNDKRGPRNEKARRFRIGKKPKPE